MTLVALTVILRAVIGMLIVTLEAAVGRGAVRFRLTASLDSSVTRSATTATAATATTSATAAALTVTRFLAGCSRGGRTVGHAGLIR